MIKKEELREIGKFQKTHALKGELNTLLEIDPEFLQEDYPLVVDVNGIFVPFFVESARPKGASTDLVKLEGIDTEEAAKAFVNKPVYAMKRDLEEFGESPDDDAELIGYSVIDSSSNMLVGKIIDLDDSTPNLLFVVEDGGGNEFLIPANDDLIREIDDDEEVIVMDIPEGLIDLN